MKLRSFLRPYLKLFAIVPIFMIVEVMVDLFQPTLMAQIVDDGVLAGNLDLVIHTGLLMLGLALVGGLGGAAAGVVGSIASQSYGRDMRNAAFHKVMHLSFEQTDQFTTGSLVTRLTNDVTALQDLSNSVTRGLVRTSFQFFGGIIMMLSLNVNFGIVLVCSLPLQILMIILILWKAGPLYILVQKRLDRVNSVVQENVTGARVVKAYVREEHEIGRFHTANQELSDTNLRVQRLMAILNPILMVIMNVSVVAIILIGGYQTEARAMNVGQVMAAITYITQILNSMMMLGNMFQNFTRAYASATRLREVLNADPVIKGGTKALPSGKGEIEFSHVEFHYPGFQNRPILKDISFTVEPGQTVAILGATGSGKTSLVQLLPRFYEVNSGTITIGGEDVRDFSLESLRSHIGFVLQKSELFSGSVRENIMWGDENATMEEVQQAAQIAQAEEFILGFRGGYDAMISEKGASLSGGQKQRLAIARAILKKPDILIFDDATSALDLSTEAKLRQALRENMKDVTILMIAQRIASIQHADKILVLEHGQIAACGTHAELLKTSPVYQDIYASQMKEEAKDNG